MTVKLEEQSFDDLPSFDARRFAPPAWASGPECQPKNGESSKSGSEPASTPGHSEGLDDEEEEEEEEVWEDARSIVDPSEATFNTAEMRELLSRANKYKAEGNGQFTSKPPKYEAAIKSYELAIEHLPSCPRKFGDKDEKSKAPAPEKSGIEEITEEEATEIETQSVEVKDKQLTLEEEEEREREEVEEDIRGLTKACWGNLAACHIALQDDKQAVKACDSALEIDPNYTKALHRRATANDRIGSATSLASAKDDYTTLLTLLPRSSPQLPTIKRSLSTLPTRIQEQQQKEMSEALGQLKELGNKFLGTFGLNTDMFKMDKAPDGSYSMKFGN